jgi:hypothetical protein
MRAAERREGRLMGLQKGPPRTDIALPLRKMTIRTECDCGWGGYTVDGGRVQR